MKTRLSSILLIVIIIAATLTATAGFAPRSAGAETVGKKICIDPGHGGSDPGAVGNGLNEKDVNLDVALRLRDLLVQDGAEVVMTRTSDVYVSLEKRVAIANNHACDIFISIHTNSASDSSANGTETYRYYGSASGYNLAFPIQGELVSHLGTKDRGVKEAGFYVLKYTKMPAVLIELAFISNPSDAQKLADPAVRQEAARAILHGVQRYYGDAPCDFVNKIEWESYADRTRVVIYTSAPTQYSNFTLTNPGRVVVDVKDAKLVGPLGTSGTIYVQDGFVYRIRYNQYNSTTVRVVVDHYTDSVSSYRVYALTNPFRIVVETYKPLTAMVYPSDDALVDQAYPSRNYGAENRLGIRSRINKNIRSFLKFDLSSIPLGAKIIDARLWLRAYSYGYRIAGVTDVQVLAARDDWNEGTVTWSNQPPTGAVLDKKIPSGYEYNSWTVTNYVSGEYASDGMASFCLKAAVESYDENSRWAYFRSKEYSTAKPYLEITYVPT